MYEPINLLLQVLLRFLERAYRNLSQVFTGPMLNHLWSSLFLLLHLTSTLGWRCFHLTNISLKVARDLVPRQKNAFFCWWCFLFETHILLFLHWFFVREQTHPSFKLTELAKHSQQAISFFRMAKHPIQKVDDRAACDGALLWCVYRFFFF